MLKVKRSVTILSKKIGWSYLQGLSWYIYKVNDNLKSKLKLIFWTAGNISKVQQENHSVFYIKDHLTSTGTLNFSTTFISKNSRSPHLISSCSVMRKSLKRNSYRSTTFGSGKSSFCSNKDKLFQVAFIFFASSLTYPTLGVKQNCNKWMPHAMHWAFTASGTGLCVCIYYPHDKPAWLSPVSRW